MTVRSCYFRTPPTEGRRRAIIQVTERCDLHCAHCFVSATAVGKDMSFDDIKERIVPLLRGASVDNVMLTGGEPLAHPQFAEIACLLAGTVSVNVSTNGTMVTRELARTLASVGGIQFNVSLDGFNAEAHDRLRGRPGAFAMTKANIELLGATGLLRGIVATPSVASTREDFTALCSFGREVGAQFVLMNPLAPLGRGAKSQHRLAASPSTIREIQMATPGRDADALDVVHIRFPDAEEPLGGCIAGDLFYIFAAGEVAVCPYLVFAANTQSSQHAASDFIVGNALAGDPVLERLLAFDRDDALAIGSDPFCTDCTLSGACGRGCPAAVVASGGRLGARDEELCPRTVNA